jgi:hypothetical protein
MGVPFSLQQIATVEPREHARKRQIHKTVETIDSRCSHAAFARVRVIVVKCQFRI